jgi:two-component system sensor histidine kinase/response regulator
MKFTGKTKRIIFDLLIPLHSLSIEEKGRRKIFLIFSILLIVPLSLFGALHIIDGNYIYGIFNYIEALILIILLITLRFQKNGKHIYRIAIIFLELLLFYWIQGGGIQGYSSIWVLTFPLFAFFLMGRKEGFFWTSICFLFTILIFVNPSSLFTDHNMQYVIFSHL